jgi:hypothetical protein
MEIFKRNIPGYKSAGIAKVAPTNGLSGLIGSLFGSATPAYKTADGLAARSTTSSGLLSMFAVAPSYKTAMPVSVVEEPLDGDELAELAEVAEVGEPESDDEDADCPLVADAIVLL